MDPHNRYDNADEAEQYATDPADDTSLVTGRSPERQFIGWFFLLLGMVILSLVWLAVRESSPSYVRTILDFFMNVATGGAVAFVAFRALFLYRFRFFDLLAMVAGLSLGLHQTVELLKSLSQFGIFGEQYSIEDPQNVGKVIQLCMIVSSLLMAGCALGLRHCAILKIENGSLRILAIIAGMYSLPAAAGIATFPVVILRELVVPRGRSEHIPIYALLWVISIVFTIVNVAHFIRTLTLKAQIDATEHLAK
jgi:hypothetical protein